MSVGQLLNMSSIRLLTLFTALCTLCTAAPTEQPRDQDEEGYIGQGNGPAIVRLEHAGSNPVSSRALAVKNRPQLAENLESIEGGSGYAVQIQFGKETYLVHFDTGSSDLWLPQSDFQCLKADKQPVPQQDCDLRTTSPSGFDGGQIPDQQFNITYGGGEFLLGAMGYEPITLAGLTVERQEVALVQSGYWQGDRETSGLMGFAYPTLTAATQGVGPYGPIQAPYDPFFFKAIKQGMIRPYFSLALGRRKEGVKEAGQLALGGTPDIPVKSKYISTPLRSLQLSPNPSTANQFSYYTIIPEGFLIQGQSPYGSYGPSTYRAYGDFAPQSDSSEDIPVIIDSGTTLVYLPDPLVKEIMNAFSPPARYISQAGLWQADCNAQPPAFAVQIGGHAFNMAPEDVLLPQDGGYDPATGGCVCGIQTSPDPPYILGDTFLRNVVAVFDVGSKQMHFAAR